MGTGAVFPTTLTVRSLRGVRSCSFRTLMRSWPADMFRSRSMLRPELRGRFDGGSGLPVGSKDAVEAFDSWSVLASDVVELLAARLSRSLWNLRLDVARAGWGSGDAMMVVHKVKHGDVVSRL